MITICRLTSLLILPSWLMIFLKSSMLSKNEGEMKYILEAANQYPDVKKIFILNRVGKIVISPDDKEIGKIINIHDPRVRSVIIEPLRLWIRQSSIPLWRGKGFQKREPHLQSKRMFLLPQRRKRRSPESLSPTLASNNIERQLRAELKENIFLLLFAVGVSTLVIGITLNQLVLKKLEHFVETVSLIGRGDFGRSVSSRATTRSRD